MDRHFEIAKTLTEILDNKFELMGFRFGIDPIIGLVPVLGDILPVGVSSYIIWVGYKLGVPKEKLYKMAFYAAADILLGLIPVLGDFVDVAYKSYQKSFELIQEHMNSFESRIIEGEKIID